MSQSCSVLKLSCLCSRLLFCSMKCNPFPVLPHTASVSLTAGFHVLSQLLFFSPIYCSVILLHPCIILILFLHFRTELGERAHVLSDHQCLHLSLCYRFLTGRHKMTSNKMKFKENGNDCEHNLICTFSKDECGTNLKTVCDVSFWNIVYNQWLLQDHSCLQDSLSSNKKIRILLSNFGNL